MLFVEYVKWDIFRIMNVIELQIFPENHTKSYRIYCIPFQFYQYFCIINGKYCLFFYITGKDLPTTTCSSAPSTSTKRRVCEVSTGASPPLTPGFQKRWSTLWFTRRSSSSSRHKTTVLPATADPGTLSASWGRQLRPRPLPQRWPILMVSSM